MHSAISDQAILIVDDDPCMREMVEMVLQSKGLPVETAADGSEALAHLRQRRPALVVLDVQLPDLTDEAIVQDLRARYGTSVPVILMSGDTAVEAIAQHLGAAAALTKPFTTQALLSAVQRLLPTNADR